MTQDYGASATPTGPAPSGLSPYGSQAEPLVPSAWAKAWGDQFMYFARKTMSGAYDRWTDRTPWHARSRRAAFDSGFEIGARAALITLDEVKVFADAQGTSAGTAETRNAAQGEARRPGPKVAPND